MTIAIIVGHFVRGKDKGAVNYFGETESSYNKRIADKLHTQLALNDIKSRVFIRDDFKYFRILGDSLAKEKPDISIELHFNSFAKAALGCECLALDNDIPSITFADLLTDKIAMIVGVSERNIEANNVDGVLRIGAGGRGYENLKIIRRNVSKSNPVVLVEPCFANFKTPESTKFFEHEELYVTALTSAIMTWLSLRDKKQNQYTVDEIAGIQKSPKNTLERFKNFFKNHY